jgi:hypothetical protein
MYVTMWHIGMVHFSFSCDAKLRTSALYLVKSSCDKQLQKIQFMMRRQLCPLLALFQAVLKVAAAGSPKSNLHCNSLRG